MSSGADNYFDFKCPHCQAAVTADREWQGMNTECPSCGKQIVIPVFRGRRQIVIPEFNNNKINHGKSFFDNSTLKIDKNPLMRILFFTKLFCFTIAVFCFVASVFFFFNHSPFTTTFRSSGVWGSLNYQTKNNYLEDLKKDQSRDENLIKERIAADGRGYTLVENPANEFSMNRYTAICAGEIAQDTENNTILLASISAFGKSITWSLFALFFLMLSVFIEKIFAPFIPKQLDAE